MRDQEHKRQEIRYKRSEIRDERYETLMRHQKQNIRNKRCEIRERDERLQKLKSLVSREERGVED